MKTQTIENPKFKDHIEVVGSVTFAITVLNPFAPFDRPDRKHVQRTPHKAKDGGIWVTIQRCRLRISHIEITTIEDLDVTLKTFCPEC